jgi:hypothetical protein
VGINSPIPPLHEAAKFFPRHEHLVLQELTVEILVWEPILMSLVTTEPTGTESQIIRKSKPSLGTDEQALLYHIYGLTTVAT